MLGLRCLVEAAWSKLLCLVPQDSSEGVMVQETEESLEELMARMKQI